MKKNILKSFLAVSLAASMFLSAGCGQTSSQQPAPASSPSQGGGEASGNSETAPDALNIVLVVSQLGDKSFNDNAWGGLQKLKEHYPHVNIKAIEIGYDLSKIEPTLMDVAPQYDIVVTGTFEYAEHVETVAPQFPETKFIQYDASLDFENINLGNVVAIEYRANEASFLGGYLNAKLTKLDNPRLNPESNIIGVILSIDAPVFSDFLIGYIDGALAADPDIKIAISYIGNFSDAAKAKELAFIQYNMGADIIFGVAGGSNMGMFDAALETNKLAMGVDSDQAIILEDTRPEVSELIVSSVLKNVGESLFVTLEKHVKGELTWGQGTFVGIKEDGVGLAENKYYDQYVPEELRNELKEVREKLYNGELTVRSGYGLSGDELAQIKNSVKP